MARRARVLHDQQAGQHPQALRRHLIEVTQRLLAAHGLTGLTTRGIAREAQVSDGVLYNHFSDKDELVVAALAERITDQVRRYLDDCPRPGEQDLRSGLAQLARLSQAFQAEALPLIGALLSRPELIHRLLVQLHAGEPDPQLLWGRIITYLEGEQELGTVAPDIDPLIVAQILFGVEHLSVLFTVLGGGAAAAGPPPGATPDQDRLVAFLVRACAPIP